MVEVRTMIGQGILIAALAFVAGPAIAQTATPNVLVEVSGRNDLLVQRLNITVEDLRDMTVFGANNEKIGDIDDVLATQDGQVAAVTLDVGGYLGVGERSVVIALEQIKLDGLRMVLNMTKEEVESLPNWDG
ncbi:PRC-barrel domain-containing protein [Roseibium salinum]|uniref:PRC-barrel domain-containing protein n=1 Tax=Roseibium salinum TaxID=1604349 RepID=A0ABT3QVQ4_9HYPH|nr:PRC-barrel domain-containing protein [Roseibium sp. DSM 29163]MCX2721005.1 PRC-barrel domain-containing protein [Roseibium sp. DSM 29163]MDN3722457.1 PRC-barrel domain-containing protein [Roseibium salinum]